MLTPCCFEATEHGGMSDSLLRFRRSAQLLKYMTGLDSAWYLTSQLCVLCNGDGYLCVC